MGGVIAPPATDVHDMLMAGREMQCDPLARDRMTFASVHQILRRRNEFGITRAGSVTRLDRIGIPVVQVSRPLALSNAVTQGKGPTLVAAAISALMESLETWAAERIPPHRLFTASAQALGSTVTDRYAPVVLPSASANWSENPIQWCEGWDMLSGEVVAVPAALVDTIYTVPSPHPAFFPRTTTGLGAGVTIQDAIRHAALEILEREAIARAQLTPHFFDRFQVDPTSVSGAASSKILRMISKADLIPGIWLLPSAHKLPTYWCHVMESGAGAELAPLPAEGFGCHFDHDQALAKALLEACQSRLAAISGAREDITRKFYPLRQDREHLKQWRAELRPSRRMHDFTIAHTLTTNETGTLQTLLETFKQSGARALIVIPLFADAEANIYVVRLVALPKQ